MLTIRPRMEMYGDLVCSFSQQIKPVRLLTRMPGNTGDRLICRGSERLLASRGIEPTPLPYPEARTAEEEWLGGTLVIPGSGAFTANWHEWLPELVTRLARKVDRVVILPSSYDPSVSVVADALSMPNVFAFTREAASFQRIKGGSKACMGMDPALYAMDFVAPSADTADPKAGGSVLVALRTDRDSTLEQHGLRPIDGLNDDISASVQDLDDFLARIKDADTIVSDRLHVVVAASMLGKSVRYFDPLDRKISTYVDWTFRGELQELLRPCDAEWLAERGFARPLAT